jgi:hypothetical protein
MLVEPASEADISNRMFPEEISAVTEAPDIALAPVSIIANSLKSTDVSSLFTLTKTFESLRLVP